MTKRQIKRERKQEKKESKKLKKAKRKEKERRWSEEPSKAFLILSFIFYLILVVLIFLFAGPVVAIGFTIGYVIVSVIQEDKKKKNLKERLEKEEQEKEQAEKERRESERQAKQDEEREYLRTIVEQLKNK